MLLQGQGIVVVDAGGGTIDVSTYQRSSNSERPTFEEISVAQSAILSFALRWCRTQTPGIRLCHVQREIFPEEYVFFFSGQISEMTTDLLVASSFTEDLDHICDCFDKTTKTRFVNTLEPQYVKFRSKRDNDPSCDIRFGRLKLAGWVPTSYDV